MTNEVELNGIGLHQLVRPVPPFDTSTPPTDGQVLVWDAAAGKYRPGSASGGMQGLSAVRFVGRKTSTGAPSSGTWAVGDLAIDSAGVWHLCTVAGTPGTWT